MLIHNYISFVSFYGKLILFSKGQIMEQKKFVENLKYIDSDKGTQF